MADHQFFPITLTVLRHVDSIRWINLPDPRYFINKTIEMLDHYECFCMFLLCYHTYMTIVFSPVRGWGSQCRYFGRTSYWLTLSVRFVMSELYPSHWRMGPVLLHRIYQEADCGIFARCLNLYHIRAYSKISKSQTGRTTSTALVEHCYEHHAKLRT